MSEMRPIFYDTPEGVEIQEAIYRSGDSFLGSGQRDFRLAIIETPRVQALAVDYSNMQPEKMRYGAYRGVRNGSYFAAPRGVEIELSVGPRGNFSGLEISFPAAYTVTPYGVEKDRNSKTAESFTDSIVESIDQASKEPLEAAADEWMR